MTQRSPQQQKSTEVYCRAMANALNDCGESFNNGKLLVIDVDWTQENFKENVFKVVMNALYPDITSTTQLDTKQLGEVYENVNRFCAERVGISVSWPTKEES